MLEKIKSQYRQMFLIRRFEESLQIIRAGRLAPINYSEFKK
jgi:TPP-dependent pyruvate/acetoin dehydrogenase alpha subunit